MLTDACWRTPGKHQRRMFALIELHSVDPPVRLAVGLDAQLLVERVGVDASNDRVRVAATRLPANARAWRQLDAMPTGSVIASASAASGRS